MTYELKILVWVVALLFALLSYQGALVPINHGFKWGLGSRDEPRTPTVSQERARRTIANHLEGMAMFVPLILAAHLAGISNEATVWGAGLFLAGRVAFAICYLAGIPMLRSLSWGVSIVGLAMIFKALVF